jgi:hypothetical protein
MAVSRTWVSGWANGLGFVVTLAVAACSNSGGSATKSTTCSGSGLINDPAGRRCTPPGPPTSPTQGCSMPLLSNVATFSQTNMAFEAEMQVAVDPRASNNSVFVATIQSDVVQNPTGLPTATCLTAKHIAVYRSDGSGSLVQMTGLPPPPAHEWATDPDIAVGPDGTLYLTFLRWTGPCGDSTDPNCPVCHNPFKTVTDVELWFAPPGSSVLQPGLPDDPQLIPLLSGNTSYPTPGPSTVGQFPAIVGTENDCDHPLLAVNPVTPGQVVVYVDGDRNQDAVYTFQQPNSTSQLAPSIATIALPARPALPGQGVGNKGALFANPAVDSTGALYLALGAVTDAMGNGHLNVQKYTVSQNQWMPAGSPGEPPNVQGGTYAFANLSDPEDMAVPSTTAADFLFEFTPALAVGALNGTTDPIVYLAFEIFGPTGTRQIELTAANGRDVTQWTAPIAIAVPPGGAFAFRPSLSFDPTNNVLDLLDFDLAQNPNQSTQLSNINLNTFFYRFDASTLAPVLSQVPLNRAAPSLADIPYRPEPDLDPALFPGEYIGLATKGLNAFAAFPELSQAPGLAKGVLSFAEVNGTCANPLSLVDPDSLWECSCQCGQNEFSFFPIVGCAAGSATTAAAACPQVCTRTALCGTSLTCSSSMICSGGFTAGHQLSAETCALSDGPAPGANPASSADFTVADVGASTAVLTVASAQPVTTTLAGQAFFNASTSPPVPGAIAEIARLSVQPADFFLGGSVNAFVRNIGIAHRSRLRGTFTDATHFQIPPGAAEFTMTLQTQPTSGALSAPVNIRAANSSALTGMLDLAHGTFTLSGTVSDTLGDSLALHFTANITNRPADANHNGIIDAVDKCPSESFGPDRTPPVFTSVPPAITISTCVNANIGQAVATDPCGVTLTNNAPARFPLGTTTVTWTAKDGAGNVATALQAVTAVLGNDTSCCPAGTNIIVGTSNNDTIVGTSGPDCILGLGGQDTISGGDGDDVISGGDGNDVISGQNGNDRIYGGSGQDTISGGLGDDYIDGGDGVDQINGDDGNDTILGGQGGDIIHGGTGNDIISGGPDDDQIFGDDGNDIIFGDSGNDTLSGGNGNDTLNGGDGDDKLDGGSGINALDGGSGHNICVDNSVTLLQCPASDDTDD